MFSRRAATRCMTQVAARSAAPVATSMFARFAVAAPAAPIAMQVRRFADAPADAPRAGAYMLNKDDVLSRVLEVVKNFEKVDASKVSNESHFVNDLGLDSLDVVEVVMALEQEFILDIPDHDAEKIQSITDAVEYISQNPMAK
eukprot:TRINITY_DN15363_c0_g1_i1.p2 TRINITY_DN15363_c0_g1~~TRINITY_DN15363_c0_g1_i1.p2  ORF type:complete len:143 (+),score=56.04 TRINITY_DN15363_c0_g1_i1:179-607(+)